ncbi:MAG TPA: hypothetical protein VIH48_00580 [Candidatus Bathyarchaeia archaeon]
MKAYKNAKKAGVLCAYLALVLTSSAMIRASVAQPWFNESNYAYFIGKVSSWSAEWVDEPYSGVIDTYPNALLNDSRMGDEPDVTASFVVRPQNHSSLEVTGAFLCRMDNISMIRFDYDEKDFYMSGTWSILKRLYIYAENISQIKPFITGLNIPNVAVVTDIADSPNATRLKDFLATELSTSNVKVFYNIMGAGCDSDYILTVDGVEVGKFDMIIFYTPVWGSSDWTQLPISEIVHVELLDAEKSYGPGELYVTGNWTNFAGYIEGIGMFSGEILASAVKYTPDKLTAPMTDVDHNRVIDIIDITEVACVFGSTIGSPTYDPDCDLNSDGIIDIVDLTAVAVNFDKTF